jgi:hypothetical protein
MIKINIFKNNLKNFSLKIPYLLKEKNLQLYYYQFRNLITLKLTKFFKNKTN